MRGNLLAEARRILAGRATLGLYNCYDPKQWHDIMRITLARAAPVALAFDCDVATFGFPFAQARRRGAKATDGLATPGQVAGFVAEGTSIGEGGEAFQALVEAGRFRMLPFPDAAGFPPALGRLVATTPSPDPAKAVSPLEAARELAAGRSQLLLYGLGPRGLPKEVLEGARHHLELTGKGIPLETATALGALPALLAAHRMHLAGGA
ncbi:MAG: uncharacterized protein QOI63_845 [Thermoplasmata archaeon]|jgi:hypothetical protein|nr:uncharacterized protein [Thermoplasmata archaeon]